MEEQHECEWVDVDEDEMRVLAECRDQGMPLLFEPVSGVIIYSCWRHYLEFQVRCGIEISSN